MDISSHEDVKIVDERRIKKVSNDMYSLIQMASSIQEHINRKKKEVRKLITSMFFIIYITAILLVSLKLFMSDYFVNNKLSYILVVTVVFSTVGIVYVIARIKSLNDDIQVERAAMKELMEFIYNFRKLLVKYKFDVTELAMIDLKLKRLQFY